MVKGIGLALLFAALSAPAFGRQELYRWTDPVTGQIVTTPTLPAFDEAQTIDRDALINAIYRTQATLKMHVEMLIRERNPIIHPATAPTLDYINTLMMSGNNSRIH